MAAVHSRIGIIHFWRIFIRQLQIFGSKLGNFDEFRDFLRLTERTALRLVIESECPLDQAIRL
ncbi:hypothetical protein [Rhodoferax sp.]|uniref:hypothetical protein n=1 Tax=Rhodoferax sp. TaxID=50421 RepID=UPI00260E18F8|nr:hypothetical protein [Rhodoferax sp.]MDD3937614.1 hypothetical protein [Rhodoferax sp.]